MIRVYFDWNVFSNINNERGKVFTEIYNFLNGNADSILIVYSPAHLQDLERSYFKSELGKVETLKDLDFLATITSNHCLSYDFSKKQVRPNIIHPKIYFEDIFIKNENENLFDFSNLFGDDEFGKTMKTFWEQFKALPTGINIDAFGNIPQEYESIKDVFKKTFLDNTLGALVEDISLILQNPLEMERIFKNFRLLANKDLKINTDYSKWGDPFIYLDQILKQNKIDKGFLELAKESTINAKNQPTSFDYFLNYYIQLDMFGYYKDKKVENLIDDSTHSFYAAHTDIFVTDDENTFRKSKALYKKLNISTDVLHSKEFIKTISRLKLLGEEKHLLKQLQTIIENSFLLMDTIDDEFNPAQVFKVEPLLCDYFDRFQLTNFQESIIIHFYKKPSNYSDFIFWTELENIVKRFYVELGTDSYDLGEFNEIEKNKLKENKWKGRHWAYDKIEYFLNYDPFPLRLNFTIKFNKY